MACDSNRKLLFPSLWNSLTIETHYIKNNKNIYSIQFQNKKYLISDCKAGLYLIAENNHLIHSDIQFNNC